MKKAELMGIDAAALEFQEAQIASLTDIRKKWHIPPAFSTEFVGYYLDRSIRIDEMKMNLEKQVEANKTLLTQQQFLRTKYDDAIKVNQDVQQRQKDLIDEISQLHGAILHLCPTKQLQVVENIGRPPTIVAPAVTKSVSSPVPTLSSTPPPQMITSRTMSVPTAAALKMGVGFPLHNLRKDDTGRILSTQCVTNQDELLNECGICKKCTEQHLLSKCDTCHLYYHLGCLNPPLTRHPKRSKLYAWQCSECDKSDDSAPENVIIPKGPRRSRIRYSKDGPIFPDPLRDSFGSEKSMTLSRKSDESHHRALNGSETEIKSEVMIVEVPEPSCIAEPLTASVNEIFVNEIVPTTSTPIIDSNDKLEVNSSPKKRGRKPKPKPSLPTLESPVPMDLTSQQQEPAPSKETVEENHVNEPNSFKQQQQLIISKMDSIAPANFPELTKVPPETPKIPKKGRPRKEKPSITQISNKLQQKKQEITEQLGEVEPKPEVTLLNLSRKFECPLEQYRTFADIPNSIPYPAPNIELPKIADESEPIPVLPVSASEPILFKRDPTLNGVLVNGEGTTSSSGHKHKKQKRHKRRHSHSPSSGDRMPSGKKHKKKRKHKPHELDEAPSMGSHSLDSPRLPEQPRIKMKFCAKFVQAGDDKKIMWSLPSTGDEVKVESYRNSSYEDVFSSPEQVKKSLGVGDVAQNSNDKSAELLTSPMGNGHATTAKKRKKPQNSSAKKARLLLNISPNKGISAPVIAPSHFPPSISSTPSSASVSMLNESMPTPTLTLSCDVCQLPGTNQNLVK